MSGGPLLVRVLLVGLSAWRLAAMLSYEDGPFEAFARVRRRIGIRPMQPIDGFLPLLFSCVWCLGPYTATAMWFIWDVSPVPPAIIASWAIVIAVERWNRGS